MSIIALAVGGAALVTAAGAGVALQKRMRVSELAMDETARQQMLDILGDNLTPSAYIVEYGHSGRGMYRGRGSIPSHHGIDIMTELGAEVYAAMPSICVRSWWSHQLGNAICLSHLNEPNRSTVYAHLCDRFGVVGDNIKEIERGDLLLGGSRIGHAGSTGLPGMFPHLHFEVHPTAVPEFGDNVRRLDPVAWLASYDIRIVGREVRDLDAQANLTGSANVCSTEIIL